MRVTIQDSILTSARRAIVTILLYVKVRYEGVAWERRNHHRVKWMTNRLATDQNMWVFAHCNAPGEH